jgi:hypothetical protein
VQGQKCAEYFSISKPHVIQPGLNVCCIHAWEKFHDCDNVSTIRNFNVIEIVGYRSICQLAELFVNV